MRVIAKDGAIAGLQLVPDEVRPIGGYYTPALLASIAERYKFTKLPTIQEARTSGAVFHDGQYADEHREIYISQLGIYNDAIAVTTTDTADSELVLTSLFALLQDKFKFRTPTTTPVRKYQSDLVVEFANDPADKFGLLTPLMEFLERSMGTKGPVRFGHIAFSSEAGPVPTFLVERRLGVPWSAKRYFCKAHLPTNIHIETLELLDKLMAS